MMIQEYSEEHVAKCWNENSVPFKMPAFPRTLSEYINTLINSGFILKKIDEPRPSPEMCKNHEWLNRWREHAALFLYFHASKPN